MSQSNLHFHSKVESRLPLCIADCGHLSNKLLYRMFSRLEWDGVISWFVVTCHNISDGLSPKITVCNKMSRNITICMVISYEMSPWTILKDFSWHLILLRILMIITKTLSIIFQFNMVTFDDMSCHDVVKLIQGGSNVSKSFVWHPTWMTDRYFKSDACSYSV